MINCKALWIVLTKMGYLPKIISIVKALYTDVKVRVSVKLSADRPQFIYNNGVKQGCVLAPTLFTIYIAATYEHAFSGCSDGVWFHF